MKQSKKVSLFIVEGVTDETTLGLILSKLIQADKIVRFIIIGGDLTTQLGMKQENCINRVVAKVKEFLNSDIYRKGDISEIVHLVDLDGTFIPEDCVQYEETGYENGTHVRYTEDKILTDRVESIIKRNDQKASILKKLILVKELYGGIPYSLYYFSCNLEHVLYDQQNLKDSDKFMFAKEAGDLYAEQPQEFVHFMESEEIAVQKDYQGTWNYVTEENHSLQRKSNFHLFLNTYRSES